MSPTTITLIVLIVVCLILFGLAWHDENSRGT